MSLQFIIGGSGSGKTHVLYENLIKCSMENPEGKFFAIVPEQFTMQTQKDIVTMHPRMVSGILISSVLNVWLTVFLRNWLWRRQRYWMIWENPWCFGR